MKRRAIAIVLFALGACRLDMHDQPRSEPYEPSRFFAAGDLHRTPPEGTIARGTLTETSSIVAKTKSHLERGRERYDIYCSPCHGYVGAGNGLVVQRGFPPPPSFHIDRLRRAEDAHIYDVITNGYGAMYDYRASVRPADRWAIVAYVRALQRSQNTTMSDVPETERAALRGGEP